MNLFARVTEGLRVGLTARSLWLYGIFVGLGSSAQVGNKGRGAGAPAAAHVASHAFSGGIALLTLVALALIAAGALMYFVSEGALIEGVTRVRRGEHPTLREGWRDGLAHWGVLFRIAAVYFAMSLGSFIVLAVPSVLALKLSGKALALTFAIPSALVAVPWLVTLYMWQAFASRIAVLEDRSARDAIYKARLFLHGRLLLGLKLIVAATLGRLIVVLVGVVGIGAAALCVLAVLKALGTTSVALPFLVLGGMVLLPTALIIAAVSGTTHSSIWTIGYLMEEGK